MICTNCGKQLNEQEKFCAACGTPVMQATVQVPTPQPSAFEKIKANFDMAKLVVCVLGIVLGLVLTVVGFTTYDSSLYSDYIASESYGGDAYTGIQNAAADTGNNIFSLEWTVREISGVVLIGFGLVTVLYFVLKVFECKKVIPVAKDSAVRQD
ncbi:MAG: zinc-ribbon domain-containing protein [Clostridia bacterium]|nr:zinc-ribbon domain-containing protein [Clostridia bacterium]